MTALAPATSPEPAKPQSDLAETTRQLHTELQRLGCYPGALDASWGRDSRRALEQFNRHAGAHLDTKLASLDALSVVRAKTGRVCPLECRPGFRADNDACVRIVCRDRLRAGRRRRVRARAAGEIQVRVAAEGARGGRRRRRRRRADRAARRRRRRSSAAAERLPQRQPGLPRRTARLRPRRGRRGDLR